MNPNPSNANPGADPKPKSNLGAARPGGRARRPRRWLAPTAAIALAALITAGLWPRPTPIETAVVSTGKLQFTVDQEGKTRIRHRYTISAPVAGQLRRIPFKAGAEISSTDMVVAVIEPVDPALLDARSRALAEARRDTAAAQLDRAKAAHKVAASDLHRNKALFEDKAVSPQELEQFQWRETAAARDLSAAESALREAEAQLVEFSNPRSHGRDPVEVHAPTAGKALKIYEESSRVVAAGTPLVDIGDPADLEVIIDVLSRDGAGIKPGTPVELDQWGGPEPLKAAVHYVEPAAFTKVSALGVEEQRVYVVADILTPANQRGNLGDNFRVEARIITSTVDHALKAPNGALFRRGGEWHAYVMIDGRAVLRPVKAGRATGTETEILEGLKEGDPVILYPGDRIKPGMRVKLLAI